MSCNPPTAVAMTGVQQRLQSLCGQTALPGMECIPIACPIEGWHVGYPETVYTRLNPQLPNPFLDFFHHLVCALPRYSDLNGHVTLQQRGDGLKEKQVSLHGA